MKAPVGNGLVEIAGSNAKERGFFCMMLASYINQEAKGQGYNAYQSIWEQRFAEAKLGNCAFKNRCPIYAKTIAKHGKRPIQLSLIFE